MGNIKSYHPGLYIKESLEAMRMTAKEFAFRTGISERTLSPIIKGKGRITFDVALKLAAYFNTSMEYWLNLQNSYDLYLLKKKEEEQIEQDYNLIKRFKDYLFINFHLDKKEEHDIYVSKVRQLVGVNLLSTLDNQSLSFVCLKEQRNSKNNDHFAQNFWIALALNQTRKKKTPPFNRSYLLNSLPRIRYLSTLEPEVFIPALVDIMYKAGISFTFLPYLKGSNIYGVTKWLANDEVMLALSNRGERSDVFWFTLFHEINHVLKEHKRVALISYDDEEDKNADIESVDMLIPRKKWDEFITKNKYIDIDVIKDFANEIDISPCIVLGRLHKEYPLLFPYDKYDKELNKYYKNMYQIYNVVVESRN